MNNNAAALLLALAALARGKQVLVSRGELIEIGGEFRIPDILAASGAKLVEVGTTNRTRISDYRGALSERTALVLKVHPSNYRVIGFTAAPSAKDLAVLSRRADVPLLYDLGSGLLDPVGSMPDEPSAVQALGDGADLVAFSGDKLLGGPQAGIVVGRSDLIERLRRHPIARAVRVDKLQAPRSMPCSRSTHEAIAARSPPGGCSANRRPRSGTARSASRAPSTGISRERTSSRPRPPSAGGRSPAFRCPRSASRFARPSPRRWRRACERGRRRSSAG